VLAFACIYVATDWLGLPRVFYLLREDRWTVASHASGPALGYPGACLSATLVGLVAAIGAWLSARRLSGRAGPAALAWMTVVAVIAALGYFAWTAWS
jgi:hypothetical protein